MRIVLRTLLILVSFMTGVLARAEVTELTFAVPLSMPATLGYIAAEKGFFKEESLTLKERHSLRYPTVMKDLKAGKAQVGVVAEIYFVREALKSKEFVVLASIARFKSVKLLVRTDRGINVPADLKGKSIATRKGQRTEFFLDGYLKKIGLKQRDLKLVEMGSNKKIKTSFIGGKLDGIVAREPYLIYAQQHLPDNTTVFEDPEIYTQHELIVASRKFAEANPETIRKFIRALIKAEKFLADKPEDSLALVTKRLDVPAAEARAWWAESTPKVELSKQLLSLLERIATWQAQQDQSKAKVPGMKSFLLATALKAERPASVEIEGL